MTVYFTSDSASDVKAGKASWEAWSEGAVSAQKSVVYERQFTAFYVAAATAGGSVRAEVL